MTFDPNLASSAHDVLLACSACGRDSAPGAWLLIAAMLAVPYAVALVVLRAIRRAEMADAAGDRKAPSGAPQAERSSHRLGDLAGGRP